MENVNSSSESDTLYEFLHMELMSTILGLNDTVINGEVTEKKTEFNKLEHIGFHTGYRLIERLTKDCFLLKDEMDCMKFICKTFWSTVYGKQVDNLRTNQQGIYVLQDNKFKFLVKISNGTQYLAFAQHFLIFTCGLIRGALCNLGFTSTVAAEVITMPAAKFQVEIQRS